MSQQNLKLNLVTPGGKLDSDSGDSRCLRRGTSEGVTSLWEAAALKIGNEFIKCACVSMWRQVSWGEAQ